MIQADLEANDLIDHGQLLVQFDCRRISVNVHQSARDKLAVVHLVFTRLACLGPSLIPVKERERVSGKVSNINQRFVNSCLGNSPSVYISTQLNAPYNLPCA